MEKPLAHKSSLQYVRTAITFLIASVWLINGLFCKVLNYVPRHEMIVARILGDEYSWLLIKMIGVLEILMFIWILSRIRPRFCAYLQIVTVATMNIIETIAAPDLLLFGRINLIFATTFIVVIWLNEIYPTTSSTKNASQHI